MRTMREFEKTGLLEEQKIQSGFFLAANLLWKHSFKWVLKSQCSLLCIYESECVCVGVCFRNRERELLK